MLTVVAAAGIAYCVVALAAIVRFSLRCQNAEPSSDAAVTIFKPIYGVETELFENLCSFCEQDYPRFQVLFGVKRGDDPAIGIIDRVIARYPTLDLSLVVDERPVGGNPKVANLCAMYEHAKHDLLVIADADMRVDRRYLRSVCAEFTEEGVGAATCLYRGVARGGIASQLGVLQLNDQFAPSVLVATLAGDPAFCLGSTMAVRRGALADIGGFAALAPYLADDYMLGALLSKRGHRVVLSRYVVTNVVEEPQIRALLLHELRWSRTIRTVQTAGYALSFVTFPLPFALAAVAIDIRSGIAWSALAAAMALRLAMHEAARRAFAIDRSPPVWLIPLRDCLGLAVWAAGLFGQNVRWKNQTMRAR